MEKVLEELKKRLQSEFVSDEIIVDEITFETKGKYHFLTVVLDKVGGIDLDTIVDATHKVNPIVDEFDITDESFILDVISKERG